MSAAFSPSGFSEKGVNAEFEFFRLQQLPPDSAAPPSRRCFSGNCSRSPHGFMTPKISNRSWSMPALTFAGVFNADRLTLYAVKEDRIALAAKVKTG